MKKNFGAPAAGTVLWTPTEAEAQAIREGGRITEAALWDNMTVEKRIIAHPEFDSHKRWFQQAQNKV